MNEWIELNLPWHVKTYPILISYPDLSEEVREKFGCTQTELDDKYFPDLGKYNGFIFEHPKMKEYENFKSEIDEENSDILIEKLLALNNTIVNSVIEWRKKRKEISNWIENHPSFIAVDNLNLKISEEHKQKESKLSFCGLNLNRAGIVVEFEDNGKLIHHLIGNINELGGVCDDCFGLPGNAVILRYKEVWNECMEIDGNRTLRSESR